VSSMGMDKSGQLNLPAPNSTWHKVTGWTTRSGFPATVITNDALVMDAMATGTVEFRGTFTLTSGTQEFRAVLNGSTVIATVSTGVTSTTPGVSVAPGDTLELQAFASSATFDTVSGSNTYIQFTQTSTAYDVEATPTAITWLRSAVAALDVTAAAAPVTVNWGIAAAASLGAEAEASRSIGWAVSANLYQGEHYDVAAERDIGWDIAAGMTLTPKTLTPPSIFSFADVAVSVHTVDGRIVGDFPCGTISTYNWSREAREVSGCTLGVMTQADVELVEGLRQWVHWITVWHDDTPVWTGPIQHIRIARTLTTIRAFDPATYQWRTRVPVSRTFTDTSPARIASILWRAMNDHHGIRVTPIVLPGVVDETFTITAVSDTKMLNQLFDELVGVGLHWTVVAGRPVLGQFDRQPVAELYECDFTTELERVRDGTGTYNDVRLQGQNWAQTAIADLAGLRLQTLISLNDLRGSANIQRAAQRRARDLARLRDELVVPANASLHPQAPVTLDDLVPGKVWAVHTERVSQLMRLDKVEVSGSAEAFDVQVTLVALEPDGGAIELVEGGRP
jgi:hypothetical protein